MKDVNYSILTSDISIIKDNAQICEYLSNGIKVIVFADDAACNDMCAAYAKYAKTKLLQAYAVASTLPTVTIIDGAMDAKQQVDLETLSRAADDFNYEQYLIEHCDADKNMIIQAGAGTGKTTVMIDRIMFLLHTVPGLMPEDIGMITFTNEATSHMKEKIQEEFIRRYKTTGLPKYVLLLERSAGIRIQTIDSFSKDFVSEFGSSIGYGSSVAIRGFKYEKTTIIRKVLNELYEGKDKSVVQSLGLKLYDLEKLIYDFWERLCQAGISDDGIANIDWGKTVDDESRALQTTLENIFSKVCAQYDEIKKTTDSISVSDIVRELDKILANGNELTVKSHKLRYLFVDEFQDSDNSQIRSIAWFQKHCGLKLFVVGDVKQSIYRFRGAVDTAFKKLEDELADYVTYTLVRNYRTSEDILDKLDLVFKSWDSRKVFDYDTTLSAQKHHPGKFNRKKVVPFPDVIQSEGTKLIIKCLADCKAYAEKHDLEDKDFQRVTVLTRTNFQLENIGRWCAEAGIPCYMRTTGTFYRSPAVLDFFVMVRAYTFPTDVPAMLEYALSPYSVKFPDVSKLEIQDGEKEEQIGIIADALESSGWSDNIRKFRFKPVMAVINEIVDNADPINRYAHIKKSTYSENGVWTADKIEKQVDTEARQYEADLEKLLTILRQHFSGQVVDLYSIYSFIKLNISTNYDEDEPDISKYAGIECLYGLTVHRSKGLEFDTIIIPFTNREYRRPCDTEILLNESANPVSAGWSYVEFADKTRTSVSKQLKNSYYDDCVDKEYEDVDREEARLLYVAMTRSIRRLECFVIDAGPHNWAGLLE